MQPERPAVPSSHRDLDPLLLLPIRLFVMCLLADLHWCEDAVLANALRVKPTVVALHVERLAAAGYVSVRVAGRRTKLRLTPLGLDRLTAHVTALQAVASTAAQLVTSRHGATRSPT
ncbi:transcriptional regulator [Amycolatopsis sp. cmx-11-32]|uniref:transcriptional regulator n=1 Tax=Amycolatopsis sp. cmx-11-32 TaxID=2785796 RepID=UPI0039E2BDEE